MVLRNHGTLSCGENVSSAFLNIYLLERACSMQVRALSGGAKLNLPSTDAIQTVANQISNTNLPLAELAWPALLRMLDAQDRTYRD